MWIPQVLVVVPRCRNHYSTLTLRKVNVERDKLLERNEARCVAWELRSQAHVDDFCMGDEDRVLQPADNVRKAAAAARIEDLHGHETHVRRDASQHLVVARHP